MPFTASWEGTDLTAKVDKIGTGHPVTYCHGQTNDAGAVKVGQRFTPAQCDELLKQSLPKYLDGIRPCIKVQLPVKTEAALLDAAYNAGPAAVCSSPMLKKMNAGDLRGGCEAFASWYVRANGAAIQGLKNRRAGDSRKGEKQLCLEGVAEGLPVPEQAPSSLTRILFWLLSLFERI
ncbi:lysozyme [Bradyrhizobium sp. HKCCYLRH2015]|uniref:lysozyme n=1 Tax=Bradyrhizobium sp. HKCCYLRH2015 TaxID=3420742 RepID=UPI003EB9AF00